MAADPSQSAEERVDHRLMGPIPDPARPPQGCRFHTRCPVVTRWCGWEIDDVIRQLEGAGRQLDGIAGVDRRSEFSADLTFDTEANAARLVSGLRSTELPAPMLEALVELRQDGKTVSVSFEPVEEVALERVDPDHETACILHTGQNMA
jgi:peptide/nickel transport system ATP-binding protein